MGQIALSTETHQRQQQFRREAGGVKARDETGRKGDGGVESVHLCMCAVLVEFQTNFRNEEKEAA